MRGKAIEPGSESQRWERFCKGDRAAFDAIYHTYFPQLFQYCIRFTTDRAFIQDNLQDFFFQLFTKPPRHTAVENLKSYLLVSVRRQLLRSMTRTVDTHRELEDNEDAYTFYLELGADDQLISREQLQLRQAAMQDLIQQLTPRQREAIYLYFYENEGYESIAEIMQLKEVKYARTLIYRALDEMRELMGRSGALGALMRP